jgi:hypothetical protein
MARVAGAVRRRNHRLAAGAAGRIHVGRASVSVAWFLAGAPLRRGTSTVKAALGLAPERSLFGAAMSDRSLLPSTSAAGASIADRDAEQRVVLRLVRRMRWRAALRERSRNWTLSIIIFVAVGVHLATGSDAAFALLAACWPLLMLWERIHRRRVFSFFLHARLLALSHPAARRLYRRYRRGLRSLGSAEPTKGNEQLLAALILDTLPVAPPLAAIEAPRPAIPNSTT